MEQRYHRYAITDPSGADADDTSSGNGIWPLFVGLFLALLTFFIVLVSISQPDQTRAQAVVGSLQTTFGGRSEAGSDEGLFAAGASALTELGGDLNGLLRIERVARSSRGDELRLSLPASELFSAESADLRPMSTALIDRIVAAFGVTPPGLRLDMAFTLGIGDGADGHAPGGQIGDSREVAIGRCGALARALVSRGAPAAAIAVGLDPDQPGRAVLSFRFTAVPRSAPAQAAARP
jgi:MotA/MotB-like proton-channel complex protein